MGKEELARKTCPLCASYCSKSLKFLFPLVAKHCYKMDATMPL